MDGKVKYTCVILSRPDFCFMGKTIKERFNWLTWSPWKRWNDWGYKKRWAIHWRTKGKKVKTLKTQQEKKAAMNKRKKLHSKK